MKIIQIKKIDNDIVKQIEQIEFSSFKRPWSRKEIIDDLSNQLSFSYIFLENKKIIGYLIATRILDEVSLNRLCIKEENRNCGYGSKLIHFFLREAYALNVKYLFLEVNIYNKNAINLYKKYGFKINRVRHYDSNNNNVVYEMKKTM